MFNCLACILCKHFILLFFLAHISLSGYVVLFDTRADVDSIQETEVDDEVPAKKKVV